tara:strand:- start:4656 stop:6593 length:1938 start_codon:yes stop_codon:yes gene_type:complete
MLSLVRKHADSWLIKAILWLVVLAFIATIFYSWGMGGASSSKGGIIATVNGEKIRFSDYEQSFNNLVQFYRERLANQFSQEMIEKLDLKTAALDGLIQKKLLLMEAETYKIRVSDEELVERIKNFPAFQREDKFHRNTYMNFLKSRRLTPKEFENGQRETLLLEKIEALIKSQAKITEDEILEAFKREEDKVKIDYITLELDHFKSSEALTEEEKRQYYEKNKHRFQVPEQVKIQYVKVATKALKDKITPQDEDIEDYYKAQAGKFFVDERYKAHHILIRINTESFNSITDTKERETKQKAVEVEAERKAKEILKRIRDGSNFEELAQKYSDDKVSGNNGGDLGQFPRGTMIAAFETALRKLKPGGISDVVKSPFGYHLIRLDEKEEARTQPIEEVRDQIVNSIKEIKARQRVRRIAKHIYKSAQSGDLASSAKAKSFEAKTTDFISRKNHNVVDIGIVPEFFNTAFELGNDRISEPVYTSEAAYVLKIMERKAPYIPEIEKVSAQVESAVQREKSHIFTEENVKVIANQIAKNETLDIIAQSLKMDVRNTPLFSSVDSIPGIGDIQAIKERVFSMKKGETAWIKGPRRHFLLQLKNIQAAGKPDTEQEKLLYTNLQKEKGSAVFRDWLDRLQKNSDIMIDKSLL